MARSLANQTQPYSNNSARVRLTRWLLRRFCDLVYASAIIKPTVSGIENVPSGGPTIGIFNHVTLLDPLISASVIHNRDVVPLADINGSSSVTWLKIPRSEEHTSELQSHSDLVCRLLLEKK